MDIKSSAADSNSCGESAAHKKLFKILVIGENGSGEWFLFLWFGLYT